MFIAQQYNFQWNDAYFEAFMSHSAPRGVEGCRTEVDFARAWDNL